MNRKLTTFEIDAIVAAVGRSQEPALAWQWYGRNGSLATRQLLVKTANKVRLHVGSIHCGTAEWNVPVAGWREEVMQRLADSCGVPLERDLSCPKEIGRIRP